MKFLLILFFAFFAAACGDGGIGPTGLPGGQGPSGTNGADGADGEDGLTSLINLSSENDGANCPDGGQKVDYGMDDDGNGTLDDPEIDGTVYVCNGTNGTDGTNGTNGTDGATGLDSLVRTIPDPDAFCANSGVRVDWGLDDDGNGVLDVAEIDGSTYVCNGADGANGLDGVDGTDGVDGSNGTDGIDSLIRATAEPAGANCAEGGSFIEYGADDNNDGVLDNAEVDGGTYVCNGEAAMQLVGAGIQQDLSFASVQAAGWQVCHLSTFGSNPNDVIPTVCSGTNILLACRMTGDDNLVLAAAEDRSVVFNDVGTGSTAHTVANGVGWYWDPTNSFGFFVEGDGVNRNSCDVEVGLFPELRLCNHTDGGTLSSGYRCGTTTLNGNNAWERVVLQQ